MDRVKSYRDLIVWQKAHELTKKIIELCRHYPDTDETRVIKKQLIRSCTSIPANIAEGYSGNRGRVYANSLIIARRETTETDYWLLLSYEIGYIGQQEYKELEEMCREVRAILSSIISKLKPSPDS